MRKYVEFMILGYLMGSVLFAYYLPKWLKGIDVTRNMPDGNPGTFNCIAEAGKPLGLFALLCELLKGAVPVFLAARLLDPHCWAFALVVVSPVVGHAFSLFRHFRGGKAIAVSFGVTLGLFPVWEPFALLVCSYLFFSLIVKVQPHRFRSILTFLCFGVGSLLWLGLKPPALGCLMCAAVVILRHWGAKPEEEKVTAQFVFNRRDR